MFYYTDKKYTHLFTLVFVSESNVTPSYSFQLAHLIHAHFAFVFDFRCFWHISTLWFRLTWSIPIVSPLHLSTIVPTRLSTLWRQGTPPERLLAHIIPLFLLLFYWISFRYCWRLRSIIFGAHREGSSLKIPSPQPSRLPRPTLILLSCQQYRKLIQ